MVKQLFVETSGQGLKEITAEVAAAVHASQVEEGLCTVFVRHTSASLVIQENADPRVLDDLERWIQKVAPEGPHYAHDDEGPDDMPSHIRSAITKTSETFPIAAGRLELGTWQALYVWEHRRRSHERRLIVTVLGA